MPQHPELTPVLPESPAAQPVQDAAYPAENSIRHRHGPHRIPHWLERAELFVRVLLRMYIGLAVCIAPWWPMLWERNPLFTHFPTIAAFAAHGAVRGIISGLGLLNLWIAFQDAIRHRDG